MSAKDIRLDKKNAERVKEDRAILEAMKAYADTSTDKALKNWRDSIQKVK